MFFIYFTLSFIVFLVNFISCNSNPTHFLVLPYLLQTFVIPPSHTQNEKKNHVTEAVVCYNVFHNIHLYSAILSMLDLAEIPLEYPAASLG